MKTRYAAPAALASLLLAGAALAKLADQLESVRMACDEDVPKVCSDASDGKREACLQDHHDALSMGCQDYLDKFTSRYPCFTDAERFCDGVLPGTHDAIECLQGRKDDVSPACRERLEWMHRRDKEKREKREKRKDRD